MAGDENAKLMLHAIENDGVSAAFYRERFESYSARGLPLISWNWAGFVFGFLWFIYRKIWFAVLPLLFLLVLGEMVLSDETAFVVRLSAIVGGSISGALFGNQLYFLWVRFLIWQGERNGKSGEELEIFLRREGGTIRNMAVSDFMNG